MAASADMGACAIISIIATALLQDYTGRDISAEYDVEVPEAGTITPRPS